uniref:PAN2-PAN3 deadenylation complex subunit PAN3 n=1 Tax=Trichuris muris TaxID=70415 RepID=A0A5S6QSG5_TRIMR
MDKQPLKAWPPLVVGSEYYENGPLEAHASQAETIVRSSRGLNTLAQPFRSIAFQPNENASPVSLHAHLNGPDESWPGSADSAFGSPSFVGRFSQLEVSDNDSQAYSASSGQLGSFAAVPCVSAAHCDLFETPDFGTELGGGAHCMGALPFEGTSLPVAPPTSVRGVCQEMYKDCITVEQQYPTPSYCSYSYREPSSVSVSSKPNGHTQETFWVNHDLRAELVRRLLANQYSNYGCEFQGLPEQVDDYIDLCALEQCSKGPMIEPIGYFGWTTSVYKAVCRRDGLVYCLRRIHACRLINSKALTAVDTWRKCVCNPYVVRLKEAFTTKAFGDYSVVLVYDFHPLAVTLHARHFNEESIERNSNAACSSSNQSFIPEATLWQYIIAISSALRAIHSAGLFAKTVDATKILVVGKSRLLINCCGIFDVLSYEQIENSTSMTLHHQQEDLGNFGRLILTLACSSAKLPEPVTLAASLDYIGQHYSSDLKNVILCLIQTCTTRSVVDIMPIVGARFYAYLEASQTRIDLLENETMKEMENGRLFRLLCKLCTVNERLRLGMDMKWAETGDRYLLKLFRDYVFHQENENCKPWIDMAHIVQCLNKLDAGLEEKIMLMSRDQQNVLVVSYQDLHRCLDQAFGQVIREAGIAEADV